MSIFTTKKNTSLEKLAKQSIKNISIPTTESSIMDKVRSFFSHDKEKKASLLLLPTEDASFYHKEKLTVEEIAPFQYSAVLDTKTFNTIKQKKKNTHHIQHGYRGAEYNFIHVDVAPSRATQGIIEECADVGEVVVSTRQQIQSMPELCRHYLLSQEEIRTLCYIVYDCDYIKQDPYFKDKDTLAIARFFCKERRHILRFSVSEYASLVQHTIITHQTLSLFDTIQWINAISRVAQIINSLTNIPDDENLLCALLWVPRKSLIQCSQGRIIDKTLLSMLRDATKPTLADIQKFIVLVDVARIISEQVEENSIHNPIPLLEKIEEELYMDSSNPVISLLHLFRTIHNTFLYILQVKTEYFLYALEYSKEKNGGESFLEQLQEVNAILYALKRIRNVCDKELSEEEQYAIIRKLSEYAVEVIRFYGINPKEFIQEDSGFYFSLFQLLAYMQYNKSNAVTPQTAVLMKFIPLAQYKTSDKPYEALHKECSTIIEKFPHIIDCSATDLENIFYEKLLNLPAERDRDMSFFDDIEKIVIALGKILAIQSQKDISKHDILHTLCSLQRATVVYINYFPEIYFSRILHTLPVDILDTVYNRIQEENKNNPFQYKVLACFISPLAIIDDTQVESLSIENIENYIVHARTVLKDMYETITYKEGYTKEALFTIMRSLMSLYYKYPMQSNAHIQLAKHANEVLSVITEGSTIVLEELCTKPKTFLREYRKELQERKKQR